MASSDSASASIARLVMFLPQPGPMVVTWNSEAGSPVDFATLATSAAAVLASVTSVRMM